MAGFPRVLEQEGDVLTLDPTRLLIAFRVRPTNQGAPRRVASRGDIEAALARLHLGFEDDPWAARDPEGGRHLNHTHWGFWVRDTQGAAIDATRLERIRQGLAQVAEWVGPVYAGGTGCLSARICPLPAVLLVAFRSGLSAAETASAIAALAAFGLHERPERSAYLGSFRYFVLNDVARQSVYELRAEILKKLRGAVHRVRYEQMPFESPLAFTPNDEYFLEQWNLARIEAPRAWDITLGRADIVIAVIDSGCDLGHADLSFVAPGVNLDDMSLSGSPVLTPDGFLVGHGTQVAGIAAAITDNAIGVAGIAGRCRILPLATDSHTDAHIAAGIRYAVEHGARVVNMSFNTIYFTLFDGPVAEAIEFAHGRRVFLCASAGNGDSRGILAPARHPLVAAVGGSDVRDERWSVPWPDGSRRGSNYGDELVEGVWTGVSVVAPAWNVFPTTGMPTTDITGTEGNVRLPSPAGDYWHIGGFTMTSCASPHVAGVAALLAAQYDLEPDAIKRIIERTADKVGSIPYAVVEGFPHGTRSEEMGYGRLNAFHAVDFADVMIRDWSGDEGIEPSSAPGGAFWIASDIVVRPSDDGLFVPGNPDESSLLTGGVTNYIYVQVVNKGPQQARAVHVDVRAVVPALDFAYPGDWRAEDATHLRPTAVRADFATLDAGGEPGRATFTLSAAQVDELIGWMLRGQHPCLLAEVTCENDYAFGSADSADALIARRNNLAQRNLGLVRTALSDHTYEYVFRAGLASDNSLTLDLRIDAGALAVDGRVELCFEGTDVSPKQGSPAPTGPCEGLGRLRLLDPVRVEADWCGCRAVVSLERGTEVALGLSAVPLVRVLTGGELTDHGCVRLTRPTASLLLARQPGERRQLTLRCTLPAANLRRRYFVSVSRRDAAGRTRGGVTMVLDSAPPA